VNAIEPFFKIYMAAWIAACGLAMVLFARAPSRHAVAKRDYWRQLAVPWRVVTFIVATLGITLIAPYTGDPTWDRFDAALMSILTFATAPWSVGTLYLATRQRAGPAQVYVAACAWLLSASWCYDLYLVLRDGVYPLTWWSNLAASSILYACAGMFWSLEWRAGRGVTFAFMEPDWPAPPAPAGFAKVIWFALPLMIIVTVAIVQFVF